jgi:hypothetical protein
MALLYAGSTEFNERYPHGALVYDQSWDRLLNVVACDEETGEVIQIKHPPSIRGREIAKIRVFRSAPLRIIPLPTCYSKWEHPLF